MTHNTCYEIIIGKDWEGFLRVIISEMCSEGDSPGKKEELDYLRCKGRHT